ncbi:unnamed protein product [Schistosoma margrebowiei]|uniref:Uncharacterized protein n=1 Tax=Schistosoma margrebowiei TaxID=48269 RepID=A0A183MPL7_9TREM|nr:unnamed protein product [Schistosoma margrebowiei]
MDSARRFGLHTSPSFSMPYTPTNAGEDSVAAASASVGLNTHKGKTKILKYGTENNTITRDGEALEEVETSTYLGSNIDELGGFDMDMKTSFSKEEAAFL